MRPCFLISTPTTVIKSANITWPTSYYIACIWRCTRARTTIAGTFDLRQSHINTRTQTPFNPEPCITWLPSTKDATAASSPSPTASPHPRTTSTWSPELTPPALESSPKTFSEADLLRGEVSEGAVSGGGRGVAVRTGDVLVRGRWGGRRVLRGAGLVTTLPLLRWRHRHVLLNRHTSGGDSDGIGRICIV